MTFQWRLTSKPYEVQVVALTKAYLRRGFAYFMEMGLGKTAVCLSEAEDYRTLGKIDGMVVLCPHSLMYEWVNNIKDHGLNCHYFVWPKVPIPSELPKDGKLWVVIINYEAFAVGHQMGTPYCTELVNLYRAYVAIDESTAIKGHKSERTAHILGIMPSAHFVRVLSGEPAPQGPMDYWGQFRAIDIFRGPFTLFRAKFCKMGGFHNKQLLGTKNEEELQKLIHDNGFRAMKKDWTDLPEQLPPITYHLELTPQQRKHYARMKKEFMTEIGGSLVEAPMTVTQMMKLQQISSGFLRDEFGVDHKIPGDMPKVKALHEIMERATGKVIVFLHFQYSAKLVFEQMKAYNPAIMVGKQSEIYEDVEQQKTKFKTDSTCRMFIIQDDTGKYGHTLLGDQSIESDACATTVFYENSFSLDTRKQAEARNHRHGQRLAVTYIDLVCSPIEAQAIRALQRKERVARFILDGVTFELAFDE